MIDDIRIRVSFKEHRKRKKLEVLLGPKAVICLIDLWISTALNHPDGKLAGMDELDIALEAGWDGEPHVFVEALCKAGLLDQGQDGYELHDWAEHQPYVIDAPRRREQAIKAARVRWGCGEDAESMQGAGLEHTDSNAPTNQPTYRPTNKREREASKSTLPPYEKIKNLWNDVAAKYNLSKVERITPERTQRIECLWVQYPDIQTWRQAFNRIGRSTVLRGNQKYVQKQCPDWKVTFDWILKADNLIKVLEGNYDE